MNRPVRYLQLIVASLALCLTVFGSAQARGLSGTASVIDGDSVIIKGLEVRLHGYDAPELDQTCLDQNGNAWPCGERAREALMALVDGKAVTCRRALISNLYVGDCRVNGKRISPQMLEQGWGVVDRRGSRRFAGYESKARRKQLNLWSGEFDYPWRWRKAADGASAWNTIFQDQRSIAP